MKNKKRMSVGCELPAMAFRNIMRNRQRTLLSGSTILLVALIICLLFSLEQGIVVDMEHNIINDVTGNIRVRTVNYSKHERTLPLQFFIPETNSLIRLIEKIDGVIGFEERITVPASIYRNDKIESVILMGIPFDKTKLFSNRNTVFVEGGPVLNGKAEKKAVITKTLSDILDLHVGDKFTFFTRTASGGSNGATFNVAAVVHIGDTDFNTMRCFLDWKELSTLLRMQGNASEILIYTKDMNDTKISAIASWINTLGGSASSVQLEALPWKQTGALYAMFDLMDTIYFFIAVILFLLASTVIFNTTMMSVLERRREIGTLMSLGMKKTDISIMVLLEILMTAGIAAFTGILIASIFITVWHTQGFNMYASGGKAVEGMNLSAWIYPSLSFHRYVMIFVTGVFIAVVACIDPAYQAMKIEPAASLRTEN